MDAEFFKKLGDAFDDSCLEIIRKPGFKRPFTYIKVQDVIRRWNQITDGKGFFSFEVLTPIKDMFFGDDILSLCRLSYTTLLPLCDTQGKFIGWEKGVTKVVEQVGGGKITRATEHIKGKQGEIIVKAGEPLDLGFDVKAAISDAFKKTSTLYGVGLYLYDGKNPEGEMIEVETDDQETVASSASTTTSNGHTKNGKSQSVPQPAMQAPQPSNRKVEDQQLRAINSLMNIKKIDRDKFLSSKNIADLTKLTFDRALLLIRELNTLPVPTGASKG